MKKLSKILFWILVVFALIQLIPVNRKNKPIDEKLNFVTVQKTPPQIVSVLKNACYDCHSDETVYPGYSVVAPISWSVKSHINEGREHLNFSVWRSYNNDLKKNMLEKTIQTVGDQSMPLPGYIVYHQQANLSPAQRKILTEYFRKLLVARKF